MKKNISVICITIILLCLTACGSKTAEESKTTENQSTGNQGEYYDLEVTEQQLWSQETQDTGSYQSMGMQFYRGEPVRFLGIPHREEGEEKTRGIDIYLEKADGSRELLFGKMPEAYGLYSVLLDGEDGMYLYDPATIIRLDSEGKELYCSIVSAATKGVATDICLLPNDRLLVRSLDNSTSKTTLWIMDGTTGKFAEKDIGMNITSTGYIAAGEEGAYLLDLFGVWSVNEKDGSKKSAFLFEGTSYAISFSGRKDSRKVMDFQIPEEGTLELLWRKNGEYSIETLRLKSVEEKTVITLRSTAVYGQIKNWIAEFNQTNEKYHIVIDECREGTDINDFVTQTGIQLATGKGADLFYGIEARSTMWSLMEKGAFEDLKPYMEASGIREEDYFPFVFDVLRKDNKIYGVYPFVSAEKYYISVEIMGEYGAPENVEALADALLAYKEKAVLIDNYTSPLVLEWFFKGSENLWGNKSYKYYQPANGNEATDDDRYDAMVAAVKGGAEVIVCPGFAQATALAKAAAEYPDVKFLFLDGWTLTDANEKPFKNIAAVAYQEEQCGYFAGYAAVMDGYTKLGFTGGGGGTNPACCRYLYGYIQGANDAAKELDVKVDLKYTWKYGETFSASQDLQTLVNGWYTNGTEVVFACGGSICQSVFAAAEANDAKTIGVDVDQAGDSDTVITSALKGLANSVKKMCGVNYAGQWDTIGGTCTTLGAKDDATGIPTDTSSWRFKKFTVEKYNELFQKVVDGTIKIDAEYGTFNQTYSNVTVTVD